MQHAMAYSLPHELNVTIGIQALHFQPGLNCLQWGINVADSTAQRQFRQLLQLLLHRVPLLVQHHQHQLML